MGGERFRLLLCMTAECKQCTGMHTLKYKIERILLYIIMVISLYDYSTFNCVVLKPVTHLWST